MNQNCDRNEIRVHPLTSLIALNMHPADALLQLTQLHDFVNKIGDLHHCSVNWQVKFC